MLHMNNIYETLKTIGVAFTEYKHKAVFTVAESEEIDKILIGTKTKNLFIKNKKGNKHWLVIIEGDIQADMDKLKKFLGESRLSFASPERLKKYLDLTPGSVSPFGLINDKDHEVTVIIYDNVLEKNDTINFHPNINTATLNLTVTDFKKYLDWTTNQVIYFKT